MQKLIQMVTHFLLKNCFLLKIILIGSIVFELNYCNAQNKMISTTIELERPVPQATIRQMDCLFTWDVTNNQTDKKFELSLKSRTNNYNKRFIVEPVRNKNTVEYLVQLPDTSYRGIYNWQITLLESGSKGIMSDTQSFFWFPVPKRTSHLLSRFYPYAVEINFSKYFHTKEYNELVSVIQPKGQLDDYSTLGVVYHQDGSLLPKLELKEIFRLLSNVGVGCEFHGRLNMWDNTYFTMSPIVKTKFAWFSTGIEKYSNQLQDVRYGIDWIINPRKYLTLSTMIIPRYQFHYINSNRELRTLTGQGWAFGIEMILSKSILNSFNLLGITIDPLRFPFQFTHSYIKDSYTGKHVELRQFRITYLLR